MTELVRQGRIFAPLRCADRVMGCGAKRAMRWVGDIDVVSRDPA